MVTVTLPGPLTIQGLDILTSTSITTTVTAMLVPINTRLTKVIYSVIVSTDRTSILAITSIEQSENTAATIIAGSNNALLIVIAIVVPGSVSIVIVPGRISRVTIVAPAAVSDGEAHSAADSADEVLALATRCRYYDHVFAFRMCRLPYLSTR